MLRSSRSRVQRHDLLQGFRGGLVIAGQLVLGSQIDQSIGLAVLVTEVAEQFQRLLEARRGSRVAPGQTVHDAQIAEGVGLAGPVNEVAEQF